jgi:acetyl-CoA synthetase
MKYSQLVEQFSWDEVLKTFDWNPQEKFNMAHECCDRWARDPEKVALYWEDQFGNKEVWTYQKLKEKSDRMANALRSLGVTKGDRVAALLGKDMALIITVLATWKIGAIYVPLFTAFGPQAILYRLQTADCKVLVTNSEQTAKLDGSEFLGQIILTDQSAGENLYFWELCESHAAEHMTEPTRLEDPSTIQFTSGSTGLAKGAVWSHKLLISVYPYTKFALCLEPDDVFFGGADPGWAYGLINSLFCPLSFGNTVVVYKGPLEVEKYYELLERYQVTNFTYAPTAYRMMMSAGPELVSKYNFSLKKLSSAGEPLNAEVVRFFKKYFGREIYDHYGATETGMSVNNYHTTDMEIKPGSMGFPTPGYEVELVDENGLPVIDGETGEIAVRASGYSFSFLGYWQDPNKTAEKIRGKWFMTGDLALKDKDGYFWFQGRSDDIISSAGYRIGPFEVESSLIEHPAIAEAAVVGIPDQIKGEIVKAFVILRTGYNPTDELADELSLFVKSRLSRHQYPRKIEFVDRLPKTPSGKIQRFMLRKSEQQRFEKNINKEGIFITYAD